MRKFIVIVLICIAIFLGLKIGMKNVKLNSDDDEKDKNTVEVNTEIYRDELNLPLIEVDTLNPLKTSNSQVLNILKLIYEPLIDFGEDEQIEGVLAYEWARSSENTWIIKLREDVTFHGGENFTADDVIFTFNYIKNNNSIYNENISNV